MITRLVPLFPYNLQNFAYGVTDMPLKTYAAGSFLFMLPGTANVYIWNSRSGISRYKKSLFPWSCYISGGSNNSRRPVKEKSPCRTGKNRSENGDEV